MPEDIFATMLPTVLGAKERGAEESRAAQEAQFQQQQRAKQAPIDDLARQVKMQQLKNELSAAPNIAKLLEQAQKQAPTTPQGPVGPQGQQPTISPQQQWEADTRFVSQAWNLATSPTLPDGRPNPYNMLDNPEGLQSLKDKLKTRLEFSKDVYTGAAPAQQIPVQVGRMPDGSLGSLGTSIPGMPLAPAGTKAIGSLYKDDKGQWKPSGDFAEKEPKESKETMEERTYAAWKKENPTIKDPKTGKVRASNENDYKEHEKLLAQQERQAVKDEESKAAAKEVIAGNLDIGPVSTRNAGIVKAVHDIDPNFNLRLQHARLTSDTAELTAVKKQRGLVDTYEKTAQVSLKLMEDASKSVDRTDMPVINRWLLSGEKAMGGSTPVARFEAAMTTFSAEYAKIMSGAMGSAVTSNEARAEIQRIISTALTQEQISSPEGIVDLIKKEMAGRISSFDKQIKETEDRIGGKKPEVDLSKVDWGSFEK